MTYLFIWFIIWVSFISRIELRVYQKVLLLLTVMLLRPFIISNDIADKYKKQIEKSNQSDKV